MLKIVFLNKIFAYNPGNCSPEKTGKKIKKNDFWGLCAGLKSVKMDPKIFKKKKHVAHSIPDGSPREKIKVRYVRGTIYGVFRYICNKNQYIRLEN